MNDQMSNLKYVKMGTEYIKDIVEIMYLLQENGDQFPGESDVRLIREKEAEFRGNYLQNRDRSVLVSVFGKADLSKLWVLVRGFSKAIAEYLENGERDKYIREVEEVSSRIFAAVKRYERAGPTSLIRF